MSNTPSHNASPAGGRSGLSRRRSFASNRHLEEESQREEEEDPETAADAKQRIEACNEAISNALELAMQGVTEAVAEATPGAALVPPATESTLFAVFEQLARSAAMATQAFNEAHDKSVRKKLKAQSAAFELKMNVLRKANTMQMTNQNVELQAQYTKKMNDKVKELISGDSAAMEAMARAEELEEEVTKLTNDVDRQKEFLRQTQSKASIRARVASDGRHMAPSRPRALLGLLGGRGGRVRGRLGLACEGGRTIRRAPTLMAPDVT